MPYGTVSPRPGADSVPYGILGENGEKDPPSRPPAGSAPAARGIPPDVTLDSSYSVLAQAASLVNQLNGSLSHSPSQPAVLRPAPARRPAPRPARPRRSRPLLRTCAKNFSLPRLRCP